MSYDLTIQFDDDATATTDSSSIESFLESYRGTERVAQNQWLHEPRSSIHVEIDLVPAEEDDPNTIHSIGIGVPYPLLAASGELALKLSFALAEHLGWRVFDEQIGDYINAADIRALCATQEEFGETADDVLASDTRLVRWCDNWTHAATQQSRLFLVIALALAGVVAMAIVVELDVQEDKTPNYVFWIGLPIAAAIFTIKISFDAWLKTRRKRQK